MVMFTLNIDPYETGYPSTVRELLNDTDKRKVVLSASITPYGKCLLICNNHIYIWSYISTGSAGIPHGVHMELPTTGLKYSTQLVCLFNKIHNQKELSLLAISPEGNLRYWAELGKLPKNEECILNNEVAHSLQQIDSQEHVHRFLLTTTTGSFHIIDLFHGLNQPDRLATRPVDVGGPGGGIGRRMSVLLFGTFTAEKEPITKTLFVRDHMGPNADVVNVLSRYLRFYSIIDQKPQNHEVDIGDLAISKYNKNRDRPENRQFRIVDAVQYRTGILLFLVGECKEGGAERRYIIDRKLFLAYYEEPNRKESIAQPQQSLRSLIKIELVERFTAGMEKRLQTACLITPSSEECCIVFHDSLLHVRHPTNSNIISTLTLDGFAINQSQQSHQNISPTKRDTDGEKLLGAAAVNGFCHLVLKEAGICTVRKLPQHYDLNFWKKYRLILTQLDNIQEEYPVASRENYFRDAYISFCAKDVKKAKQLLRELMEQMKNAENTEMDANANEKEQERKSSKSSRQPAQEKQQETLAEMAADLLLYFMDRRPTVREDPRWTFSPDEPIINEQRNQLRQMAETKKFDLIHNQLKIKTAFYKMFVLFLRTHNLVEWIDYPLHAFQMRSGKAVIAELGEKLIAMSITFQWLSECSQELPLINRALSELAKQYITKYGLPKGNPYLSPTDYVFNKVSTFHELVSVLAQTGQQAMEEAISNQARANIIREVGSFLITLINGVENARETEWAMQVKDEYSTWLNQPDFLTHFTTQLNLALDYLTAIRAPMDESSSSATYSNIHADVIKEQCIRLAEFVLTQQSANQRNDSKIIARFFQIGDQKIALKLAEKYKDFTFLVVYCYNHLDVRRRDKELERYKQEYGDDFFTFLLTWYQQKGMFNHLLAERGQKASEFLSERQQINWIRQIEEGNYSEARTTLKQMSREEKDERKKLIELSLCKLAALCEEKENVAEIAELSEKIRPLQERLYPSERQAEMQQMEDDE